MSKKTKTLIWIASALMVIGILIGIGALSMARGELMKLTTEIYQTKTYEISDAFTHISLNTSTAKVELAPSEDGKCKVVCYDTEKLCHTARVENNTLTIQINDNRKWYDYISINLVQPTVTVYLPGDAYGALTVETDTGEVYVPKDFEFESMDIAGDTGYVLVCASAKGSVRIDTDTGNVTVSGISAGSLDLSTTTGYISVKQTETGDIKADVSTGMVRVSDTRCANLSSVGDTGYALLENVIATGKFSIERDTGDVTLTDCDASEIYIETDTGNINGSLLTPKIFDAHTDTGRVSVPSTTTGGICKITTDTGSIRITVS